jgi:hypothetical protein
LRTRRSAGEGGGIFWGRGPERPTWGRPFWGRGPKKPTRGRSDAAWPRCYAYTGRTPRRSSRLRLDARSQCPRSRRFPRCTQS